MAKCSDTERAYLDSLFNDELARNDLEDKLLSERISKKMRTDYSNAYLKWKIADQDLLLARSAIYAICSDRRAASLMDSIEKEANET